MYACMCSLLSSTDADKPTPRPFFLLCAFSQQVRGGGSPIDLSLITYFALWFWGNAKYNIWNKLALKACKTEATPAASHDHFCLQLGVGWSTHFPAARPDGRAAPTVTLDDKMLPSASGRRRALGLAARRGSVSSARSSSPRSPPSPCCLTSCTARKCPGVGDVIPIIGGVMLFHEGARHSLRRLVAACIANLAAVKGNENKKLMDTPGQGPHRQRRQPVRRPPSCRSSPCPS